MKLSSKKYVNGDGDCDEYPGYARFVEEATIGYSAMQCSRHGLFPTHMQGRFASCSPEHTLLRLGGGGNTTSGPGGSGTASWGVGKRGQLGHGKRDDEREPKLLMGKIGWGTRIVQVSAGGGLVRVAHSLLLTSTGRVLSFGNAQYGQLGHGYDAGKVLSDCLRPRYIDALKDEKCICIAAGELHSGAVTINGDVYCWGEGFCGQLGLGDRRPHLLPEQVTLGGLEDECVSNISCGCRHTLVTTEECEVFSWGLGRFGVLGRSYTDFTYQNDVGMAVPEGEEGIGPGAAARPPPMQADAIDAAVAAANGEEINALMESLEALNLVRILCSHHGCKI
jgi:alpha-tubulin suppressor-like RCC1 family protein